MSVFHISTNILTYSHLFKLAYSLWLVTVHHTFLFFFLCQCLFLLFCDVILWFYAFIPCKVTFCDLKGAIKQIRCIIIIIIIIIIILKK